MSTTHRAKTCLCYNWLLHLVAVRLALLQGQSLWGEMWCPSGHPEKPRSLAKYSQEWLSLPGIESFLSKTKLKRKM